MGKVFLITGTRKGIGRQLAEHYLERGHVVAGCSRGESGISHGNYVHFPLDVSNESAVVRMVGEVRARHKTIDVLLNNAGIASMNHVLTTPFKTVQEIFATNYFGTFLFLREVSKVMMKARTGRIVNFTTVASPLHLEGEATYAASKAAIENLTRTAARELADFGITVNAVGPTPVPTDLIRSVPKEKLDALLARQAIRRFGEFRDIVNVVDFFIEDRSDFVTGQILYLGGVSG